MTGISFIILSLCVFVLVSDLMLILCWKLNFKSYHKKPAEWPTVSVLVAARNEEDNIEACLHKLVQLDYPKDKIEILVGDDQSSDNTFQLASNLAQKYHEIKVYAIKEHLGKARGKANVLATLAKYAKGRHFFITDADIQVPASWIKHLLAAGHENVGIISGVTAVSGKQLFSKWQNIEWLNALGMLKVVTDMGIGVTGVGNNMMVSREAYEKVGGYENIPFSIVEDYQLTKYVLSAGYKVVNLMHENVKALSNPLPSLKAFFHQRKRWMQGALKVPAVLRLLLILQALTIPLLVGILFVDIQLAIVFIVLKYFLRFIFIVDIHKKIKHNVNFIALISYEIYAGLLTFVSVIYFILPTEIDWKGRKYK